MSESIIIRRALVADAAAIARVFDSPGAYANTLQQPLGSAEVWRERLEKRVPTDPFLVAETGGIVIAQGGINVPASLRRRHVGLLGLAVRDDWQGRGVGTALMRALIDHADNWIGLLRLELEVFVDNERAIAMYRKYGFETEGRLRAHAFRNGAYVDSLLMARLRPGPWPTRPESGPNPAREDAQ